MPKPANTFCPLKWDEVLINLNYNYIFSCCKAAPVKFVDNYKEIIEQQKQNLLTGIQDPSCEFCWSIENKNQISRRQKILSQFDMGQYQQYANGTKQTEILEINVGNSCNLQCMYCNPKFSSKWEEDVKVKNYPVYHDRYVYAIESKNKNIPDANEELIQTVPHKTLRIIGGEPLNNNKFFDILELSNASNISCVTNLMTKKENLDKLLSYQTKFKNINIGCSIDATKDIAEFVRLGLNFDIFFDNLNYLLEHIDNNVTIEIQSLMTNITVLDINRFKELIVPYLTNPKVSWIINHCVTPRINSFETLYESHRQVLIDEFDDLKNKNNIFGIDVVISALDSTRYNPVIHKEFRYFLDEWQSRKNIILPKEIYAKTK